jgi:hypothetical protein
MERLFCAQPLTAAESPLIVDEPREVGRGLSFVGEALALNDNHDVSLSPQLLRRQ